MPQNPLETLKNLAMRNVPKRAPTQQEEENLTFRAQAIQDEEPTWKKLGRNALDFLPGMLTSDPFSDSTDVQKGLSKRSVGEGLGMLAGAAPAMGGLKKLPIISPEAYNDVKAGGLRLYSRLTDTFAKAPAKMKPAKAISLAQSGASREEITLRKLNDFLKGRDPLGDIPREEIMGHLAANPLELEIERKGGRFVQHDPWESLNDEVQQASGRTRNSERELNSFIHELDNTYGGGWDETKLSPEHFAQYESLINSRDDAWALERTVRERFQEDAPKAWDSSKHRPQYEDDARIPGPNTEYGETLIKLPKGPNTKRIEAIQAELNGPRSNRESAGQLWDEQSSRRNALVTEMDELEHEPVFDSGHYGETDPNTLVWSRYDKRTLDEPGFAGVIDESPGTVVGEIQSDWHQRGRKDGYRTPEVEAEYAAAEAKRSALNDEMAGINKWPNGDPDSPFSQGTNLISETGWQDYNLNGEHDQFTFGSMKDLLDDYEKVPQKYQGLLDDNQHAALQRYLGLRKEEGDNFRHYVMDNPIESMVPDAPFKDTYQELAMKQQLLDWADDPDSNWFGVADAATASHAEGHTNYIDGPGMKEGMRINYDEKHPSILEKLLTPLGGNVEHAHLPSSGTVTLQPYNVGPPDAIAKDVTVGPGPVIASSNPYPIKGAQVPNDQALFETLARDYNKGRQFPGPGIWKASGPNQSAELKQLIKERGFPAMAAFLALAGLKDEQ